LCVSLKFWTNWTIFTKFGITVIPLEVITTSHFWILCSQDCDMAGSNTWELH
jgi:hypothetical protein